MLNTKVHIICDHFSEEEGLCNESIIIDYWCIPKGEDVIVHMKERGFRYFDADRLTFCTKHAHEFFVEKLKELPKT